MHEGIRNRIRAPSTIRLTETLAADTRESLIMSARNGHRKEEEGDVGFERIRRITGYLVGTMDHWNNAKAAEEKDRVKHDLNTGFEKL